VILNFNLLPSDYQAPKNSGGAAKFFEEVLTNHNFYYIVVATIKRESSMACDAMKKP
jgi:hypothetical protein